MIVALILTVFAGLSTSIGSALALLSRRTDTGLLSLALGFSGGVMVYISFVEMFPEALESIAAVHGEGTAQWLTAAGFFGGMLAIAAIDFLVPSYENPHHHSLPEDMEDTPDSRRLMRMGVLSALAIAIHNFPEGIATFFATLHDPAVGVPVAIAVALHNVPEGIAVAVPVFYATGSRTKAFWYSSLSGFSEPVGAVVGYLVLRPWLRDDVLGMVFAVVAGIMVFISLDQLIPNAKRYGRGHQAVYGLVLGMAVMAVTLLVL